MLEVGSFGCCVQRTAGEFTSIALDKPVPFTLAVALGQPEKENRVQILYLPKGVACQEEVHYHYASYNHEDRRDHSSGEHDLWNPPMLMPGRAPLQQQKQQVQSSSHQQIAESNRNPAQRQQDEQETLAIVEKPPRRPKAVSRAGNIFDFRAID
jgi:hypothetical protein